MDADVEILEDTEEYFKKIDDDFDYAFALSLSLQEVCEENENEKENEVALLKSKSKELSIVDGQWELIDPNPDINALFVQFDSQFFYNKLQAVQVRWSPRMTLCAGVCCYEGRGGLCSIRLSIPLLKLRPRRDLVETLLHEMIHAYLFVTENHRDRDGHGPNFLSHMYRINKLSGTNITVYHTFHDEVDLYKQHWWKCDGPCQNWKPFFGIVKRSMNRAPGPNDRWWKEHQFNCGGKFLKIKEPENYKKKAVKRKVTNDFSKDCNIKRFIKSASAKSSVPDIDSAIKTTSDLLKQNHHSPVFLDSSCSTLKQFVPFQGTPNALGHSSKTTSSLLEKYSTKKESSSKMNSGMNMKKISADKNFTSSEKSDLEVDTVSFRRNQPVNLVQSPISKFLTSKEFSGTNSSYSSPVSKSFVSCPVCSSVVHSNKINSHLDQCLVP